jgi:hypothetical protein
VQDIPFRKHNLYDIRIPLQTGEISCLYAEVDPSESLPQLTRYFLEPFKEVEDQIDLCEFSWGCLGIPRRQKSPSLILSHVDSANAENISLFVNLVLPRLALFSYKINYLYHGYQDEQKKVEKITQKLTETLRSREHERSLQQLEERIKGISSQLDELVEELGVIKPRLIGMDNNLRQIRRLLRDPIFEGKSDILWQIWGENSLSMIEQVQVDFARACT